MARSWTGQEPPEFPRDASGLSPFRQRWHSFMTGFVDVVRRLFLHSKTQDVTLADHETRIHALEAAPSGGGGKVLAKTSLRA